MKVLDTLRYTESHEWIKIDGNVAFVGISDFAQHELGDIVHVELPEVDEKVIAGEPLGNLEAVKTVEDIISPVSGKVIDVNVDLFDSPELINNSCYDDGWLIKVQLSNMEEIEKLLTPEEYRKLIAQ